jgi:hypothetical protein
MHAARGIADGEPGEHAFMGSGAVARSTSAKVEVPVI